MPEKEMKGMKGMVMGHKHVFPLTVGVTLVTLGLLQQFYARGGNWNLVITGVVTFLVAGLWHDKMCKMG